MLSILKRPPHDNFTFRLFFKIVNQLTIPHDSIYIWSAALDSSYFNTGNRHLIGGFLRDETELYFRNRLFDLIQEDLIILGIKDHLTSDNFDPSVEDKPSMVQYLEDLFNFYPNKKFILFG